MRFPRTAERTDLPSHFANRKDRPIPGRHKSGARGARALRHAMTPAERRLWWHLGRVPVENTHFRRQAPIGRYVVDFVCHRARLIIERDGGHQSRDDVASNDQIRTRWLENEGYRVIRFRNGEVVDNLEGVLDTIHAALYGSPESDASRLANPPPRLLRADPPPHAEGE